MVIVKFALRLQLTLIYSKCFSGKYKFVHCASEKKTSEVEELDLGLILLRFLSIHPTTLNKCYAEQSLEGVNVDISFGVAKKKSNAYMDSNQPKSPSIEEEKNGAF